MKNDFARIFNTPLGQVLALLDEDEQGLHIVFAFKEVGYALNYVAFNCNSSEETLGFFHMLDESQILEILNPSNVLQIDPPRLH